MNNTFINKFYLYPLLTSRMPSNISLQNASTPDFCLCWLVPTCSSLGWGGKVTEILAWKNFEAIVVIS